MRRGLLVAALALAGVTADLPAARADDGKGVVRLAVEGAVSRTRRKIALGPLVGVGGAYSPGGGDLDVPISFGLGLTLFKVPIVPSVEELQALLMDEVKRRVAAKVEDMVARGEPPPTAAETAQLVEDLLARLRDEYLGKRPRDVLVEKPQLAIALEEVHLPSTGAWMTRLTAGIGISKITIGPSITGSLGDVRGLYLGGEAAVHLTPGSGPRSPVIDLLIRADWGVTGGAREVDLYTLGVRAMLDII